MSWDWPARWPSQLVPLVSYAVAAAAFALLAALLLTRWRARPHAAGFGVACLMTAIWAGVAAASGAIDRGAVLLLDGPEVLRTAGWLMLLLQLGTSGCRLRAWLAVIGLLALLQLVATVTPPDVLIGAGGWPALPLVIRLGLAVLGMLLVEHVYRGAQQNARWGIKFACLGIGALFAYDFYLYSDALLFHRIHADIWAARGAINALSAPLLVVAVTRNPTWTPGLLLSRQMMFRSAALLGSALYLLAMAGSAWYLRYIGGAWGAVMQLVCLVGAALLLAAVLFSGTMRARLKIFISKHFYQGRYDYRHEWRRVTQGLAEDGGSLAERSIQALAGLVESPAGVLWLRRDADCFQPAASWNMPLPRQEARADSELCGFLQTRRWVIEMPEWRGHPRRYGGLALPAWLTETPSLWLVVPLMLERSLFGFICLARPRTAVQLNWEVRDVLKIAGSQAASYLAHRESADNLAVARQFESFNRMSTFIVHDLKNLVSQLSLLLVNAERHKANPAFQEDMLETLSHSLDKMKQMLLKLRRDETPDVASPLALERLLAQAVRNCAASQPAPTLEVCGAGFGVLANRERLERVLGHLIQNAVEATPRDGSVTIKLRRAGDDAVIALSDTGHGMSEEFIRDRLFKPFESTKTTGMGIGVFESREYLREIGGRLEVSSVPARGTTFRVTLPLQKDAKAANEPQPQPPPPSVRDVIKGEQHGEK
jgi:putative PEP-CTERM system histidine kinase